MIFRVLTVPGVCLAVAGAAMALPAKQAGTGLAESRKAPPSVPALPAHVEETERGLLLRAGLFVSVARFAEAESLLKPLMPARAVPVHLDWGIVPEAHRAAYRSAIQKAAQAWSAALEGKVIFELTVRAADHGLKIVFEPEVGEAVAGEFTRVCAATRLERQTEDGGAMLQKRLVSARIALNLPESEKVHTPDSIGRLAAHAIGAYLGLASSDQAESVMGPDTHDDSVNSIPSREDVQTARELLSARTLILQFAREKVAAHMARPILEVEKSEVDAGDIWKGDRAVFTFTIRNSGESPLEIQAKPNCGCTVAKYDKLIPPGGAGSVEAELKTASFKGKTSKLVTVKSNDPEKPQISLKLTANIRPIVEVTPASTTLSLAMDQPTVREYRIKTQGPEPAQVTRVTCSAPFAVVSLEPESGAEPGTLLYKLTLTVKPEAPLGRSAVTVTAFTDSKREPRASLSVVCEKGILAIPASLYLGALADGPDALGPRSLNLLERDSRFQIKSVSADNPRIKVDQQPMAGGFRLTVTYLGGLPAGPLKGFVVVETDDPIQPQIKIPFMGQVIAKN